MTIATRIFTLLRGELVGTDSFGNRYYIDKKVDCYSGRKKRWVVYNGKVEASKVPPEWHGWLHYTTDEVLQDKYEWQQEHLPNLTGTDLAHCVENDQGEDVVSVGYQVWKP